MTLANNTPFAALAVPYVAPDGRDIVVAIVKATFVRRDGNRMVLADEQIGVRLADVPYEPAEVGKPVEPAPLETSIRYPSDVGGERAGTCVVVVGEAVAKRPAPYVDVAVQVAGRTAPLRVHGERVYYRGAGGVAIGPAASFERKGIVYERAYGGASRDLAAVERRNPVGRGVASSEAELVDTPAPQIEHPANPISNASMRPEPAGYGAMPSHWLPRSAFAGTYDAAWKATRMPLLPKDFDARHYRVAHPSLQFEAALAGGTDVAIIGMTTESLFRFALPDVAVRFVAKRDDGARVELASHVDMVLIEPNDNQVQVTARRAFLKGRSKTRLREIRIEKGVG